MKKLAILTILALGLTPAAYAEEGGAGGPHGERGGHMAKVDTDGDGKISKAEFVGIAEQRFSKMDKNGDGFITKDERPDRDKMRDKMKKRHGGGPDGVPEMKMDEPPLP